MALIAPAWRSAGLATVATTTTSVTITKPTGLADGDVLYAVVTNGGANAAPSTVPTNWVLVASSGGATMWGGVYRKVIVTAAGEPADYTWSGFTNSCTGCMVAVSGANTSAPEDTSTGAPVARFNSVSANTGTAGLTTTVENALILSFAAVDDNQALSAWACATDPTSLTERAEQLSSGGVDTGSGIASAVRTTAGATGASSYTLAAWAANVGLLVAVKGRHATATAECATATATANNPEAAAVGATMYARSGGGNWSAASTWSLSSNGPADGSVPTTSTPVILDASSGNVTIDTTTCVCRDLTATTYAGTVGGTNALKIYGSIALSSAAGSNWSSTSDINLEAASGSHTVSLLGSLNTDVRFGADGASTAATWTLTNNLTTVLTVSLTSGTFDTGGYDITSKNFLADNGPVGGKVLNLNDTVWTLTGTSTIWSPKDAVNGMTLNAGTSHIVQQGATSAADFFGAGWTYYDVTFNFGHNVSIANANTFRNLSFICPDAVQRTVTLPASTTQTVTGDLILKSTHASTTLRVRSSVAATAATFSKSSGTVVAQRVDLQDNTGTGGASFFYGADSVKGTNVTGWNAGAAAECATATAAAEQVSFPSNAAAESATAAASAETVASVTLAPTVEQNSASSQALDASPSVAVNAECATATASALDATVYIPPQNLLPVSDITTAGWTTTPLWSKLDENFASPDDGDFIRSSEAPVSAVCEVALGSGVDPAVSTGHIVNYRYRVQNADSSAATDLDLTVELVQGTTIIATRTVSTITTTSFVDGSFTLTGGEADAITNYADLRIRLTAAV